MIQDLQTDAEAVYVERARALIPLVAAHAATVERDRRIPEEVLSALFGAGLFRLLIPRAAGGAEVRPSTYVRTIEAIAQGDASTAWCLSQAVGSSIAAGALAPHVANEVFGSARSVIAWGQGKAQAVAVEGGYQVNANCAFASGVRHATWLGAHCTLLESDGTTPRLDASGKAIVRTMIFPVEEAQLTDIWRVMGLRGTASDQYAVENLFVPAERSFLYENPAPLNPGTLYLFSGRGMHASGFGGLALGLARGMLDAFVALAKEKTPRGMASTLRENAVVQMMVAQSTVRLDAARIHLLHVLDEVWNEAEQAGKVTLDQRVRIRLAGSYAVLESREVATNVYHAAGATTIFESGDFERRFRDMHTVSQQVQGRTDHYVTVGKHLLGLDTTQLHL